MPELCGRSLKENSASGAGSHGPTRDGSGKGGDPPGHAGKERRAQKEARHPEKMGPGPRYDDVDVHYVYFDLYSQIGAGHEQRN